MGLWIYGAEPMLRDGPIGWIESTEEERRQTFRARGVPRAAEIEREQHGRQGAAGGFCWKPRGLVVRNVDGTQAILRDCGGGP